jgi:glutamate/aspartate transport system permease protein
VALLGFIIALVIGVVIGTLRTLQSTSGLSAWVSRFAVAWVELFRDVPLLVQVFLWYHVAPFFLPSLKSLPSWLLVSIALGLFTSARIAEQVRAGIQSLPRGQRDAARALGLREVQVYRRVILPVALRIMMPALTSEAMSIVKNSSVAFVVAVAELTQFAMQAQEETARGIEIYLAVTLLYALTAFAVNRVLAFIESRVQVPGVGALARQGA